MALTPGDALMHGGYSRLPPAARARVQRNADAPPLFAVATRIACANAQVTLIDNGFSWAARASAGAVRLSTLYRRCKDAP